MQSNVATMAFQLFQDHHIWNELVKIAISITAPNILSEVCLRQSMLG